MIGGRRPAAPAQTGRSVVAAAALTAALLLVVGLTATRIRIAPPPAAAPAREAVEYVVAPAPAPPVTPLPPPDEARPSEVDARPRPAPTPAAPRPGLAGAPRAGRDSGRTDRAADRAVDEALRRGVGSIAAPDAVARLCALAGTPTRADSTRRALAGCPPPTADELRRAADLTAAENARIFADAARRGVPPTQAEIDAAARKAAMDAALRPTGVPPVPSGGASFNVGLPGGGPSNAQRKRDRVLDADVSARLKRIREQGEARLRARADSAARADSVRRATP